MSSSALRIGFIRHGETDWNVELRMQGHVDTALNAHGLRQAQRLGARFVGVTSIAALYCSDLWRARQTAQPVADALGMPVLIESALRERDFGRCEGLTYAEISERFPDDAMAMKRRDADHVPPDGESRRQHQQRVVACVERLARTHAGASILAVTHGGVLDVVYRRARGLDMEASRDYPIGNTSINWIVVQGDRWCVESWGDTAHLDALGDRS